MEEGGKARGGEEGYNVGGGFEERAGVTGVGLRDADYLDQGVVERGAWRDDGDAVAGIVGHVLSNVWEVDSNGNAPGGEIGAGADST